MREIKFRAWVENEHVKNGPYPFMNHHIEFTGGLINDIFATSGKEPLNSLHNKITYMQYTGLKDKNGKEIYEGDILTTDSYPYQDEGEYNYHLIVEYIENGFCGVMNCVNAGKRGISHGIAELLEFTDQLEIIGNIYENPELLEATV